MQRVRYEQMLVWMAKKAENPTCKGGNDNDNDQVRKRYLFGAHDTSIGDTIIVGNGIMTR